MIELIALLLIILVVLSLDLKTLIVLLLVVVIVNCFRCNNSYMGGYDIPHVDTRSERGICSE
jgi:hypothetical protein